MKLCWIFSHLVFKLKCFGEPYDPEGSHRGIPGQNSMIPRALMEEVLGKSHAISRAL